MTIKKTSLVPSIVSQKMIEGKINFIRDKKVMLDRDIAALYGVTTKRLNEQVKRNQARFPDDFMFQLTKEEYDFLRSQFATLKNGGRGLHSKYLPYAFTEHGAVMLASVLNSPTAINASIFVVKAFVSLREIALTHSVLKRKMNEIEKKLTDHDQQFKVAFLVIEQLLEPPVIPQSKPKKKIGFQKPGKD